MGATLSVVGVVPHGTVTFLFTDVEGSTRLWERHPVAMRVALAVHDTILRSAIEAHGGYVFSTGGDAFTAAFWTAGEALGAAIEAQRRLTVERWAEPVVLRVRMGIHTGIADERGGDYFGPAVNRAARLMAAAYGGQVLVSAATERLLEPRDDAAWRLIELGDLPLKDLTVPETVFRVVADGLPEPRRPSGIVTTRSDDLPRQPTSFIGRGDDLERLDHVLRSQPLVTLVGQGGVGKTRLALQAGAQLAARFDGVYFADLAPIADAELVAVRLIEALGHIASGLSRADVDDALVGRVGARHLLLILDNCEHLVEECARLTDLLVARCPHVVILATSRQPLAVAGEQVVPVGPLTLPARTARPPEVRASSAGALFIERARRVRPGFDVTDQNVAAVIDICWLVEGLPLAIELAAGRVRAMTPAAIARRLSESHRLLSDGPRTGDPRHHTLEACLRWSFDALSDAEATVLGRLSIFAGGATLDAAIAVAAGGDLNTDEVEDALVSLVDKSLVLTEEHSGDLRYRLHELVRQFAAARLQESGETVETGDRHLAWCTDLVRRISPGVRSLNTLESVDPLLPEADNLAAGIAFALRRRDAVSLTRLLGGGGEMWAHVGRMRQLAQWWDATMPLIPHAPDAEFPPNRLALTLASAAAAYANTGRYGEAETLVQRAAGIRGVGAEGMGFVRWAEAVVPGLRGGDPVTVVTSLEALIATVDGLAIESGTRCMLAIWLVLTGQAHVVSAVLEDVLTGDEDALDMWLPTACAARAVADVLEGRVQDGVDELDRVCHEAASRTTHWRYVVYWLAALGHLLAEESDDADRAMRLALIETRDSSMYWSISWAVETAALHCLRLGDRELAAPILAALDAERGRYGGRPLSGHPSTVLYPIRQSLTQTRHDDPQLPPLDQAQAVDGLLRRLQTP